MPEHELTGCAPDPLYSNLKALGIFRIIAEQKDPNVIASWKNNVFVLDTELDKDELINFFLNEYSPTPIVSPWNNGSGFYDIWSEDVEGIRESMDKRVERYQAVLKQVDDIMSNLISEYKNFNKEENRKKRLQVGKKEGSKEEIKQLKEILGEESKQLKKITDDKKTYLLSQFRNKLPEETIPWMDAAYVVASEKPTYGRILGTGGNDGNFEISANFMKYVNECVLNRNELKHNKDLLKNSLYKDPVKLVSGSFAYFCPGGYQGSATSNNGEINSLLNMWDFILAVEGTMLFAGNISRRSNSKYAAFPFTTYSSNAGYDTSGEEKVRGEIWIPLWDNPATYSEIRYVFGEGRSQVGKSHSSTGVDFARSLASLGVQRGLSEFQRFGIFERKGQAYFATGIGRLNTTEKPHVNLLAELDEWIKRIRKDNQSSHMASLLNNIDDATIRFCTYNRPEYLQSILITVGKIESLISRSKSLPILNSLSSNWIEACYDGSPEFRLATSIASMCPEKQYPVRENLEPVKINQYAEHMPKSTRHVWKQGQTLQSMTAVLKRRCLDAQIKKTDISLNSKIPAPLKDIMSFLEGNVDYEKIGKLLLPLSMIHYNNDMELPEWDNERKIQDIPALIPESYICLKSNFPPIAKSDDSAKSIFEPSIINLLMAGNVNLAVRKMRVRLQISGYNLSTYSGYADMDSADSLSSEYNDRLAASLLFPIRQSDREKIIDKIACHTNYASVQKNLA